jgi:hypothetical protein
MPDCGSEGRAKRITCFAKNAANQGYETDASEECAATSTAREENVTGECYLRCTDNSAQENGIHSEVLDPREVTNARRSQAASEHGDPKS